MEKVSDENMNEVVGGLQNLTPAQHDNLFVTHRMHRDFANPDYAYFADGADGVPIVVSTRDLAFNTSTFQSFHRVDVGDLNAVQIASLRQYLSDVPVDNATGCHIVDGETFNLYAGF